MAAHFRVTDAWVASAISSKLRAIVSNYKPTGFEKEFSFRSLYDSIDPSWHPNLVVRDDSGINWIGFPSRIPHLSDLKDEDGQIIPLRIYFGRTPTQSYSLFFQINSEFISIKYVEQGVLILESLKPIVEDVRRLIDKEISKDEKIRTLVENSAETTIRTLLKGKELSYHIDFLQYDIVLLLLLPYNNRVAQFTIPYDKFANCIEGLPQQVDYICKSIQGFPYTLRKVDYRVKWTSIE